MNDLPQISEVHATLVTEKLANKVGVGCIWGISGQGAVHTIDKLMSETGHLKHENSRVWGKKIGIEH